MDSPDDATPEIDARKLIWLTWIERALTVALWAVVLLAGLEAVLLVLILLGMLPPPTGSISPEIMLAVDALCAVSAFTLLRGSSHGDRLRWFVFPATPPPRRRNWYALATLLLAGACSVIIAADLVINADDSDPAPLAAPEPTEPTP